MASALDQLIARQKEVGLLSSMEAVLDWDEQTYLPKNGIDLRADQKAYLSKKIHAMVTEPKVGDWLAEIELKKAAKTDREKAIVREAKREYDRYKKMPESLVERLSIATTKGRQAWEKARHESNFSLFEPALTEILRLKREQASVVGYEGDLYHAFMDPMEPGMTVKRLEPIFNELKAALVPLLEKIEASPKKPNAKILAKNFPVDRQKKLGEELLKTIGFDLQAGRLDITTHPFCSGFYPNDVRLTTRYNENELTDSLFSTMHEGGHGLYEQGLPVADFGLATARAASFGVHESQSRLWENYVGRSLGFWKYFFPRLQEMFPAQLQGVTVEEFWFAVNSVRRSYIRTESDEVTYNLHIILRYEIERALLSGDLPVKDLPNAWNTQFQAMFGIAVPDDRHGCLQDVHWSSGGFGYFPTYTLGNLLSVQFAEAAEKELGNLETQFTAGKFLPLRNWLKEKIHQKGQLQWASELCESVTGKPLSAQPFLAYLNKKFSRLYL